MKRYYRDSDGTFKESASENYLMHSTGKWDRSKTKYVKIVKSPSGKPAYLYADDLEPGKKYGPKVGEAKADEEKEVDEHGLTNEQRYGQGNIDLYDRPVLKNDDGSISTVDSFSVNIDGEEVLLPSIGRDKDGNPVRLSEDDAIAQYKKDGKHLGKFKTPEEATEYAKKLHEDQEKIYSEYAKQLQREGVKSGSGKIAVVGAGGKEYGRFGSAKDALDFVKGKKKDTTSNEASNAGGSAAEAAKQAAEEAKKNIAASKNQNQNVTRSSAAKPVENKKSAVSKSKHLTEGSTGKETKIDHDKKRPIMENEAEERAKRNNKAQISLDTNTSTSVGVTRGLFGNSKSKSSSSIKPANLKAKPGATSGTDTAKGKNNTADGRPRGREVNYSFEKKSGAKEWHVKEGSVGKGNALSTYKQVGNTELDEFLKKLK